MRKLKIAGLVLLGLIAVFVLGGFLISPDVELSTQAHLAAPPERVFAELNTHEGEVRWWTHAMKPHVDAGMTAMEVVHAGGPTEGEGMRIDFIADGKTAENWEVIESESPSRLVINVDFQIFVVQRTLLLEPDGTGTKITWTDTAHIGNPVMRYMTLMPSEEVIANFDGALVALDDVTKP